MSNAVRHTPRGGEATPRARARGPEEGDGGGTVIEVADTGPGIGAEELTRVFDRFWPEERSRGRQTGGSGLGRSVGREPAEAHAGSVTAAGAQGAGSVLTLTLPG